MVRFKNRYLLIRVESFEDYFQKNFTKEDILNVRGKHPDSFKAHQGNNKGRAGGIRGCQDCLESEGKNLRFLVVIHL